MTQSPPPHYGGPYQPAPSGPPKKDLTVLWVALGVGLVVILVCCCGGYFLLGASEDLEDDSDTDSSQADSEPSDGDASRKAGDPGNEPKVSEPPERKPGESEENPAPLGKPAQNESARYRILDVDVTDSLSDGYSAEGAIGAFVVIELSIRNVKGRTIEFSESDVTLLVGGDEIEVDDDASFAMDDALVYEDISPGLTKRGRVAFDVQPKLAGKGVLKARAIFSNDDAVYLSIE